MIVTPRLIISNSLTYWNNTVPANYSRGRNTEKVGITPEEWANFDSTAAWQISDFNDFYRALASASVL